MKKIYLLLIIISTALIIGCYESWYPVYDDWLCTINIDGSDLKYIRDSYEKFLLSPDRETLIEYCGNKFYSVNLNDLSYRTLLFDFGDDVDAIYQPAMSNTKIVFSHHGEIYTFDLEDRDTTRLTFSASTSNWRPAFSSDGNKIVYTTKLDSLSTIVLMNSDGSDKTVVYEIEDIEFSKNYISSLRYVQNGEKILFIMHGNQYSSAVDGIYSINFNGSGFQCIVENICPSYLTVSPNEDYILFVYDYYIQKVNIDGTGRVFLTESSHSSFYPSITPGGQKILYAKELYPYIMNADGTNSYKMIDKTIGKMSLDYKESYFLNNYTIILNLNKQIN